MTNKEQNTKTEEIGKMSFGETKFQIEATNTFMKNLKKQNIDQQYLLPTSPLWFQTILHKLNANHNEGKTFLLTFYTKEEELKETKNFLTTLPLAINDSSIELKLNIIKITTEDKQ